MGSTAEEILYELITSDAQINTQIAGRMYPGILPQGNDVPAIIYNRISTDRLKIMQGPAAYSDARIQLDIYSESYKTTKILANRVRHLLDYYDGRVGGTELKAVFIEGEGHSVEEDAETEQRLYRATLDLSVIHDEEL